jgi:hypothetical protein
MTLKGRIESIVRGMVAIGLAAVTTTCGSKKDPGADIGIAVSPSSVILVGGTGKSCADKYHTTITTDPRSITEYRAQFSRLTLQWRSSSTLTVVGIRITIDHPEIAGGTFTQTLQSEEIEYLLGRAGGQVSGTTDPATPIEISTTNTGRGQGTLANVPSCPLHFGGMAFASKTPSPFTATAVIEVFGYAEDSSGNQSPVRQRTRAAVEYY